MANCRYCAKEITWLLDGKRKVPVENDGSTHKCENYIKSRNSYREIDPSTLDEEALKRLQSGLKKKK